MKKNDLLKKDDKIIRILEIKDDKALVIDCIKRTMPVWIDANTISDFTYLSEISITDIIKKSIRSEDDLSYTERCIAHKNYTLIAGILPFVDDEMKRSEVIKKIAEKNKISSQTLRKYLCIYLVYQDISALIPRKRGEGKGMSIDEKNFRWALNKFFYTKNKNSLKTAYTFMLKEKYCDKDGVLMENYPSFYQFRYYYRKHNKLETYYISRNGLKDYQRNNRLLLGEGVQDFAPNVGVGMLDTTICDIYLVDDVGNLVGRPILTACIDAYSSLCCGYSLSWEGGVYSIKNLMLNVITDKVDWCKKFGIGISKDDWNANKLPGVLVTDMGSEYKSETFEQITELGVKLINLPAYRPELKGAVEKFFDVIQNLFKPILKGKGVIEPNFQERGAHDYRKDACLTIEEFEKIILHCIIYYNSKRIIENFPYTDKMVNQEIKPYASCIWNWGMTQPGANLINVKKQELILTLLPRTTGKFSRFGLKVNKLRYNNDAYTEQYLRGEDATVAYNPDDVSCVWLLENGKYISFELIESRFDGMNIEDVGTLKKEQSIIANNEVYDNLQAKIELMEHIRIISDKENVCNINLQDIRKTRKKEQIRRHTSYMEVGGVNEYINA